MTDTLELGAGSGVVAGGLVGNLSSPRDRMEGTIKGAVIGGVLAGITSYIIFGALERRDDHVRRETLMNLEHYEVLGTESVTVPNTGSGEKAGKCLTVREVDGRKVEIPCALVDEGSGQ